MKTLTAGHRYELENLEGGEPQTLQFIQKEPASEDSIDLVTVVNGTTNEEVLAAMIDRLAFLHDVLPDQHTASAMEHVRLALADLEARRADRKERGVEGTRQA